MRWLFGLGKDAQRAWDQFWFGSRSDDALTVLAFYRVCFALVMLFAYVSRIPDLQFFYADEGGILPAAYRVTVEMFRFRPTPLDYVTSLAAIQALHAFFLLALVSFAVGFHTRISAVLCYLLHMTFLNRNMAVQFGVDTIGTFFFFYFCFVQSGARFSIDAWRGRGPSRHGAISHVAYRLMQLQVCIIYGYSGMDKLKGTRWWDGSAFWDVLSAGSLQRFDMSFVAHAPVLIATVVYVVLLWEVYFPVLVWLPKLRLAMLAFGVMMHLGIFLFMNLPSFGFLMIANYVLFLKADEIRAGLTQAKLIA